MSCLTPFIVRKKTNNCGIPVPCGRCPECLARRVSAWSFRLLQEEKVSSTCVFLTLTYDTSRVPISRNGFMSLSKRDCQLFMKRLRKAHGVVQLKYYLVGEYGGKTKRPHYHVLLFNANISLIQPAWNCGNIHYGKVSGASVGYTLKYMNKPPFRSMHKNDDREPVFALMSKGLGISYLTDAVCNYHKADVCERVCCVLPGGKKVSMPRYYKDKIYDEVERSQIKEYFKWKMRKENDELTAESTSEDFRDRAENDLAAFRKMDRDRDRGLKL